MSVLVKSGKSKGMQILQHFGNMFLMICRSYPRLMWSCVKKEALDCKLSIFSASESSGSFPFSSSPLPPNFQDLRG